MTDEQMIAALERANHWLGQRANCLPEDGLIVQAAVNVTLVATALRARDTGPYIGAEVVRAGNPLVTVTLTDHPLAAARDAGPGAMPDYEMPEIQQGDILLYLAPDEVFGPGPHWVLHMHRREGGPQPPSLDKLEAIYRDPLWQRVPAQDGPR